MKVLVIGDIHHRNIWTNIIKDKDLYDKIIFIGDYMDSYDISHVEGLYNLKEIIRFKSENNDKVVLLLGNHDISYYWNNHECSGMNYVLKTDIYDVLSKNIELFNIAYNINDYLFTHAGVSSSWLRYNIEESENMSVSEISEHLNNMMFSGDGRRRLFSVGAKRGGYAWGGPVWADLKETCNDQLPNINQVVGHTPVLDITTHEDKTINSSITYIDCLDKVEKYLVLDIF